ncbi:MAG: M48 family metalloprotease [Phycisphaerales bacterium]
MMHRYSSLLLCVIALLPLAACETNATTGRNQLVGLSRAQEIQIGEESKAQFTAESGGEVPDRQLDGYVDEIGRKLAAKTPADNPGLPWEFTLLNSNVINAFALPGGKVFISKGLADKMTNEAQMAGVLGHEIGHVCARHTSERVGQQQLVGVSAALGGVALGASGASAVVTQLGGLAINVGGTLIPLKFSRDQESEADSLGMRFMVACNYNPAAQSQVMQILQKEAASGGTPEFLATHPYPETRIERINKELATTYKYTQNNPQFQFYEVEYRTKYLKKAAMLPEPTHGADTRLALGDPAVWCQHCREAAAASAR